MDTVLVTGFGPFGKHDVNASWEAVKELSNIGFDNTINLIIEEIPVEYNTVKNLVPKLWDKHKPKLCVHVGVSEMTQVINIEEQAFNTDYDRDDITGQCPESLLCVTGGCECLKTSINIDKICKERNPDLCPCLLEPSNDAGRFLCEFIYYTSLNESCKTQHKGCHVVFIHVPMLCQPYTSQELALSLKYLVTEILKQT